MFPLLRVDGRRVQAAPLTQESRSEGLLNGKSLYGITRFSVGFRKPKIHRLLKNRQTVHFCVYSIFSIYSATGAGTQPRMLSPRSSIFLTA